jgi:hypothetical protein
MTYGRLLQDAARMNLDVLSAMRFTAETWNLTTPLLSRTVLQSVVSANHV